MKLNKLMQLELKKIIKLKLNKKLIETEKIETEKIESEKLNLNKLNLNKLLQLKFSNLSKLCKLTVIVKHLKSKKLESMP